MARLAFPFPVHVVDEAFEATPARLAALREGRDRPAQQDGERGGREEDDLLVHGRRPLVRTHLPLRPRKLLLHRREIDLIAREVNEKGLSLVPLRIYFTHGMAKVEVALARGKRKYEKRQSIAKREAQREMERAAGRRH